LNVSVERLPGSVNVCGRAAAKGPRAAARHKVTTQFREILQFPSMFQNSTCGGRKRKREKKGKRKKKKN